MLAKLLAELLESSLVAGIGATLLGELPLLGSGLLFEDWLETKLLADDPDAKLLAKLLFAASCFALHFLSSSLYSTLKASITSCRCSFLGFVSEAMFDP